MSQESTTERIVNALDKKRSGEFTQLDRIEDRIGAIEDKVDAITTRLVQGDGRLDSHDEKIGELRRVVFGTIGVIVLGVLGLAGTALVFVIQHLPKGTP